MLLFIIYIALIAIGIFLPKTSHVYDVVVIVFLTLVTALNTTHADYAYYSGYFNAPETYDPNLFEPGWQLLCQLGRLSHLSYNGFVAVLVCVLLCLTMWACGKLQANRSFFWALLLIFPALLNIVQIRQFVAIALIFAGGVIFATRSHKVGVPIYILAVLLAMTFHKTAIIMIILLGIPLLQRCSTVVKAIIVAGIALAIGLCVAFAPTVLQPILGDRLIYGYLSNAEFFNNPGTVTYNRILMGAAAIIIGFVVSFFADRFLQRSVPGEGHRSDVERTRADYVRFGKYVALVALALVPFAFLDADILRVYRYFLVFGLGALCVLPVVSAKLGARVGWKLIALAFVCFAAYAFVNYGNTFHTVTESLLTFASVPPMLQL